MSGSVLSLYIPSRHAILYDRGEPSGCFCPIPSPVALAFAGSRTARHSQVPPHHPLQMGRDSRGFPSSLALRPAELLASLADFTPELSAGWSPFPLSAISAVAIEKFPPAGLSPAGTSAI